MDDAQESTGVEMEVPQAEPDINRKVTEIEEELNEIRSEFVKNSEKLENTVSSLQDAVVEIRSAVSEIENPFNVLRLITSEKDLDALQGARGPEEGKPIPKPVEPVEGPPPEPAIEERSPEIIVEEEKAPVHLPPPLYPVAGFTILRLIWDLLDLELDEEDIMSLCSYCEYINYLPTGSSNHVAALAPMAAKARKRGASREEFMLNIYAAAAASGVEFRSDDVNEVILGVMELARENNKRKGG